MEPASERAVAVSTARCPSSKRPSRLWNSRRGNISYNAFQNEKFRSAGGAIKLISVTPTPMMPNPSAVTSGTKIGTAHRSMDMLSKTHPSAMCPFEWAQVCWTPFWFTLRCGRNVPSGILAVFTYVGVWFQVSAAALLCQLPRLLMECPMLWARRNTAQSRLVYCKPWSVWITTG